jgi:hypothetical protein
MFLRQLFIPGISASRIILLGAEICPGRKNGKRPGNSELNIRLQVCNRIDELDPAFLPDPEPYYQTCAVITNYFNKPESPCN